MYMCIYIYIYIYIYRYRACIIFCFGATSLKRSKTSRGPLRPGGGGWVDNII